MRRLLSGNEAVARGAYECGCTFAAAYPGTPSTEILEALGRYPGIEARWSTNEKVAYETAVGASLGGLRALVAMKHVGLNVAADPLFSHAYMGVDGGLVVVSADDPGMHSSQNEQDNRWLARAAKVPMIEPSTAAEASRFTQVAFALSEAYDTPVMLRMTTRVCHSIGEVEISEPSAAAQKSFHRDFRKYVLLPVHARRRHEVVEEKLTRLAADAAKRTDLHQVILGTSGLGVISSGAAWLYAMECFPTASHLKLGLTNPFPATTVREFAAKVGNLLVIEEGDPYIEEQCMVLGLAVRGRELRPPTGELSLDLVARMAGEVAPAATAAASALAGVSIPPRPPVLCAGCSHRGVFTALKRLGLIVAGDIGCYTLGALPPLSSMDTCLCMGASIGMATGLERALPEPDRHRVVGVIGDSTFLHSGMTGLIDAVYHKSRATYLVLDNRVTAMTGHQAHPGSGRDMHGKPAPRVDIAAIARAVGVERVRTVDAWRLQDLESAIREETRAEAPSVIVVDGPCVLHERKIFGPPVQVRGELCTHCESCLHVGCPSIGFAERTPVVNQQTCIGCTICQQVCFNCPAANDVAGFLQLAIEKRYDEALDVLLATNPFPALTGRICPRPCEAEFNTLGFPLRGAYQRRFESLSKELGGDGKGLSVRAVERFLGDWALQVGRGVAHRPERRDGRVAVVGSGPAGLTCAWYLAHRGVAVTLFEQLPEIGGMLRAGIPDFRLPRQVLRGYLDRLEVLGVESRTRTTVGRDVTFEALEREFDAMFLATGFSEGRPMQVPGEDIAGVRRALDLLRDANLGRPVDVRGRVLVVGGGNAAMDVARVLKRLGAEPRVAYRRRREDMPALPEEIDAIEREGIPLEILVAPIRIVKHGGGLRVTFIRMKPGAPDESRRPRPEPIDGSEYTEDFDQVVSAVGEAAGFSALPAAIRHDQRLVTTDFSSATNLPGVFAGGDLATGYGTVAHAIRSGRKGADAVLAFLAGRAKS